MKPASLCPAALAALALALFALTFPAPANPVGPANPAGRAVEVAPPPHNAPPSFAHTALGAVIEANGGTFPTTGTELNAALAKLGNFAQLPVTFSAVALHSGLSHPRVILTMRQSAPPSGGSCPDMGAPPRSGGWAGATQLVAATPLGTAPTNKPYLHGRLFLAANTELNESGLPVIKTVEFISWNSRKQKFDFGVVEGMGTEKPEPKFLDGARCFSCHKNRGPILGVAPWSNTAQNDLVRSTSAPLFKFPLRLNKNGEPNPKEGFRDDIDGLRVLMPNGPEVDVAVRQGADVLRDRDRFKLLAQTADGRKAFAVMLNALAARGALDAIDKNVKLEINRLGLITFLQDAHTANKTLMPSALADYNPALHTQPNSPINPKAPAANAVTKYDAVRAAGGSALPSEHQPSNPKAFVRPPAPKLTQPSQLVSAVALARAIGLSEDDRTFLATSLDEAVKKVNDPAHTPAALAKAVFSGPSFADVLKTGVLPERDHFKDRFVAGLVDVVRTRVAIEQFWHDRRKYASAPKFDPDTANEQELVVLPSHACAACHDFRTGTKPAAFNPIPVLAFDPFDATARDAWVKNATRKQKQDILGRLLKRIDKDKDMPPEDSVENEMYRVKDAIALSAVKEWLDAELKKLK